MKPRTPDGGTSGLFIKIIRSLFPIREQVADRLDETRWNAVNAKFRRHQSVAEAICLLGLITGMFLPSIISPPMQVWDIGIGLGTMCCLPIIYIAIVCYLKGFVNYWNDFADFSTMKYAIHWNLQLGLYVTFGLIAIISITARVFYPITLGK